MICLRISVQFFILPSLYISDCWYVIETRSRFEAHAHVSVGAQRTGTYAGYGGLCVHFISTISIDLVMSANRYSHCEFWLQLGTKRTQYPTTFMAWFIHDFSTQHAHFYDLGILIITPSPWLDIWSARTAVRHLSKLSFGSSNILNEYEHETFHFCFFMYYDMLLRESKHVFVYIYIYSRNSCRKTEMKCMFYIANCT
jgi:hypothetical protein